MENLVLSRPKEESNGREAHRFLVMRALARLHECDEEALIDSIDATDLSIRGVLREMVSKDEVEVSPARPSMGKREATFALTLNGWREYMKALGSMYELPE